MSIVRGGIVVALGMDAEDLGVGVVGQKLIYGCVVVWEGRQRTGLLALVGSTVLLWAGSVELMLFVVNQRPEADLGTTSSKDLEVVAVKGEQGVWGELGSDEYCHGDSLSIG